MASELLEKAKQVMSLLGEENTIELQAKEGETLVDEPEIARWLEYITNGEFAFLEGRMAEFVPLTVKRFLGGVAHALTKDVEDWQQIKDMAIKTLKSLINVADSPEGKKRGWNDKLLGETIASFLQILVLAGNIPEEQAEEFVTSVLDALEQEEGEKDVTDEVEVGDEDEGVAPEDVGDVDEKIGVEEITGAEFADWLASVYETYTPPQDVFAYDGELSDEVEPKASGFILYLLSNDAVGVEAEFAPIKEVFRRIASEKKDEISEEEMTRLVKNCLIGAYCMLLAKAVFRGYAKPDSSERIRNFAKLWLKRLRERGIEPSEVEGSVGVVDEIFEDIPESEDEEEVEVTPADKPTVFANSVLDALTTSLYDIASERNVLKSERVKRIKEKIEELANIVGIDAEDLPMYPLLPKMRKLFALSIKRAVKRLLV